MSRSPIPQAGRGAALAVLAALCGLTAPGASAVLGAPPDGYLHGSTMQLGIPANGLPPRVAAGATAQEPSEAPASPSHAASPAASPEAREQAGERTPPLLSITGETGEPSPAPGEASPPPMSLEEIHAKLEAYLRENFHRPRTLDLSLEPVAPGGLAQGHFQRIDVAFSDGHIDAIPVARARVAFYDVTIDLAPLRERGWVHWHSTKPADAHISISEANINQTLQAQQQMLHVENPHMSFKPGRITFAGRMRSLFGAHRVTTTGTLRLSEEGKILYHPEHLALGVISIPHGVLGMLERKVNPILDLTRLGPLGGVELKLRRLQVTGAGLEVATRNDDRWALPLAGRAGDDADDAPATSEAPETR